MLGKPKYNIGDTVEFSLGSKSYTGKVYIIDKYGTFDDDSDVSYDVMVENFDDRGKMLVKHLTECLLHQ